MSLLGGELEIFILPRKKYEDLKIFLDKMRRGD